MAATRPRPRKRVRREPERSCIACRRVRSKRELVRIVRTPAGSVAIDPTGKLAGRGAYVCREALCWEKGLQGTALEHYLHLPQRLAPQERERLLSEGLALSETAAPPAREDLRQPV